MVFYQAAHGAAVEPPVVDKPVDPPIDDKPGKDPNDTGRTNRTGFTALTGTETPNPLLGDRSAGTAVIGNSGAATYAIPIVVPPGTNGVAPKLSFVYNSQSQENGIMGIHWQLKGLPAIERCPRTIEQDAARGGINYDSNDRFCLDGARLMPVTSGTYGADGMHYRTEVDSGVKVISYGSAGGGPSSFTVQTKAGEIMEFGNTPDSKIERAGAGQNAVRVWALNNFKDSSNNYFTVTYTEDNNNGDYRPSLISYTINGSLGANRYVVFEYENRTDNYPMYVGGSVIKRMQRLTNVKTCLGNSACAGNSLVKNYKLQYAYGTATQRSRVTSIQECSDVGCAPGATLPANLFGWQEGGVNFATPAPSGSTYLCGEACRSEMIGDVDGDGKSDFIYLDKPNGGQWIFRVYRSTGAGFVAENWGTYTCAVGPCGNEMVGDFNGDGKADVLHHDGSTLRVSLSNGTAFLPQSWGTYSCLHPFGFCSIHQVTDVNGDGRTDYFYRDGYDLTVRYSNGSGFDAPVILASEHNNTGCGPTCLLNLVGDFNGDGKADFLYRYPNSNTLKVFLLNGTGTYDGPFDWGTYTCGTWCRGNLIGDFNGDGKSDFLFVDTGNIRVFLSTGARFEDSPAATTNWGSYPCGQWCRMERIGDFNGDGKSDFMYVNDGVLRVYLSRGNTFFYNDQTSWGTYNAPSANRGELIGDYNGDGKADFVYVQSGTGALPLYLANSPFPDLITSIQNGFGGTSTITYKPITDSSAYTRYSTSLYPNQDFQQALYVVSNLSVSDGMPGNPPYLYTHKYEGGKFNHQGRGWLGFRTMATEDHDVNTRTIIYLNQYKELNHAGQTNASFALTGTVDQVEVERASDSKVFSLVKNFYATTAPYVNNSAVKLVNLTRVENFECEGFDTTCGWAFRKTARNMEYTFYGNLTRTHSEGDVAIGDDQRDEQTEWSDQATGYDPISHSWLHRPIRVHTYNPSAGNSVLRERWLYYDNNNQSHGVIGSAGLLTKVEDRLGGDRGSTNNPVTVYKYEDGFGNRTSVIDPRGCETKTDYEATYQTYPEKVTACNNLTAPKFFTTYEYNERYGTIKKQTDPNLAVTTWTYDAFGRLEKMIGPLDGGSPWGTFTRFYVSWGQPGAQSVNTYRTEQHGTGNVLWANQYVDGLGRVVGEMREGPDSSSSGKYIYTQVWYDSRNRVTDQWVPFFINSGGSPLETTKFTAFSYDPLGRPTQVINPDNTTVTNIYELSGIVRTFNERGKETKRHFDAYGQLKKVEELNSPDPAYVTEYFYDPAGSLTQVKNALNHYTTITYDLLGRKVLMCDPNMGASPSATSCNYNQQQQPPTGAWIYGYNLAGDLTTQVDAKTQQLDFTYDKLGRIETKKQGTTSIATWTYDDAAVPFSKGRLTKVVDRPASTNLTTDFLSYDAMGRVLQTKRTYNNSGQQYTLTQGYDALSRITSETFSDEPSNPFLYSYNEAGWLASVSSQSSGSFINNITYNARGQKKTVVYPNGQTTEFDYFDPIDNAGSPSSYRLQARYTSGSTGVMQNLAYTYQPNGNVETITEYQYGWIKTYYHDDLDRIRTVPTCANSIYDKIGNVLDRDCNNQTRIYNDGNHPSAATYPPGLNRNYTYDLNGNMATRGGVNLCWDIENRLINAGATNCGNPTANDNYHYDYTGMRVRKNTGTVTLFPFKGYEVGGGVVTKYVRIGNEIYASKIGSTKFFYHNDHLGGVNLITDAAGNPNQRDEYGTWGAVTLAAGNVDPLHRFTGQELDQETGLMYYGGRYYDTDLGRFISPDPFIQDPDNPQSLNRYTYVLNNPQKYIDPSGYFSFSIGSGGFSFSTGGSGFSVGNASSFSYGGVQVQLGTTTYTYYPSSTLDLSICLEREPWACATDSGPQGFGVSNGRTRNELERRVVEFFIIQEGTVGYLPYTPTGQTIRKMIDRGEVRHGPPTQTRSFDASSVTDAARLRAYLAGQEIAGGHAFDKHVLQRGEFTGLDIRTRAQFAQHIEHTINSGTTRQLSGGRTAFYDEKTNTVVIRSPNDPDGGTAFRPITGRRYFEKELR